MKKQKLPFKFSVMSVICLCYLLAVVIMWPQHHVYPVDELQTTDIVYAYTNCNNRVGGIGSNWIHDSNGNSYRYIAENLHPFGVYGQEKSVGKKLHLLIEPEDSHCIAYLEMDGKVYFSLDDYYTKVSKYNREAVILKVIFGSIFIIQLSVSNYLHIKMYYKRSKKEKLKQEKMQRLRDAGKLHPKKQQKNKNTQGNQRES